jgi:hypothetical protein
MIVLTLSFFSPLPPIFSYFFLLSGLVFCSI